MVCKVIFLALKKGLSIYFFLDNNVNTEVIHLPQYSWLKINELFLWVQVFHLFQLHISGAINFTTLGFCRPTLPVEFCYDKFSLIKPLKCHQCCILQLKYKNTSEVHNTFSIQWGKHQDREIASRLKTSSVFDLKMLQIFNEELFTILL